jgi:hypothetical protein
VHTGLTAASSISNQFIQVKAHHAGINQPGKPAHHSSGHKKTPELLNLGSEAL